MRLLTGLHAKRARAALALAALTALAACLDDDDDDGSTGGGCSVNPTAPECTASPTVLQGTITQNTTLSANQRYTLRGFVKVPAGVTLTIPAGTVIVGDTTQTSALFILRGGRINAAGTAAAPIVMTSGRAAGNRFPGDWGGLIVVGNGVINRTGSVILEGTATRPEDRTDYGGGASNLDNSGTLSYVRVEFAGFAEAPNAELNSFTFAAVGSGTTVDHLQSLAGLDDSFEWFGGAVNGRFLVSYEAGDDHFDAAEGYTGKNQFLIALQTTRLAQRAGATGGLATDPQGFEIDGCDNTATGCTLGQGSTPYNMPMFANFTVVGPGPGVLPATAGVGTGMVLRRGTGGTYVNGIIARWPIGMSIRDTSSINRLAADSLTIRNVSFAENAALFDPASNNLARGPQLTTAALDSSAATVGALFAALPAAGTAPTTATLNFTLAASATARTNGLANFTGVVSARAGTFITATPYRGAVDPNGQAWYTGWTNYARN